jgi:hypothetical protein
MAAEELAASIFDMAVSHARSCQLSFSETVDSLACNTHGQLLFDVRVEGDAKVQRIAAVTFGSAGVGILALSHQAGLAADFIAADLADFLEPLTRWARLPLRQQVQVDHFGAAILLVAALRLRGTSSI